MSKKNDLKNKSKNKKEVASLTAENQEVNKVTMVFKENKFYNDFKTPIFEAGKEYVLEGAGWIQRWLKRGGKIVDGKLGIKDQEVNESTLVESPVVPVTEEVAPKEEKPEDVPVEQSPSGLIDSEPASEDEE